MGAGFGGPVKLEGGKGPRELGKVGLIGALVGAALGAHFELAAGDRARDNLGQFADLVVQVVGADVERLVMHRFHRGSQDGQERSRDVLDVDHRAPRFAVAVHDHFSGGDRSADKIVQHRVEAHARRQPVDGSIAQESRRKTAARELAHGLFGAHLGARIFGARIQRSILIDDVGFGHAVHDARGGKQKALDARGLGGLGQARGALVIDLARPTGIQIADPIVAQGGKMNYRIETFQIGGGEIANIFAHRRHPHLVGHQSACIEITGIYTDDSIAGVRQQRRHDRADIAVMSREQNSCFHAFPFPPSCDR